LIEETSSHGHWGTAGTRTKQGLPICADTIILVPNENGQPTTVCRIRQGDDFEMPMNALADFPSDVANAADPKPQVKLGILGFKALAETIPSLVFVSDAAGANIYTNVRFSRYTGLSSDALLGDGWLATIHPDDRARAASIWNRALETGEFYEAQHRVRRFDGDYRWHVVRGSPLRDTQGEVVRWVGACTDIEELVPIVSSRTNSDAILSALGHGTGMIIYAKDADCRFVFANQATVNTLGLPVDQIIGRSCDEIAPGLEQAELIREHDKLAMIAPDGLIAEEYWPAADGSMRIYRSRKARLRLADGSLGVAAATIDITYEKDLEGALRQSQERLASWIDAVPVAAFETDAAGRITMVNQHWLTTCGFPVRDAEHSFNDLVVSDAQAEFALRWTACRETGQAFDMKVPIYDHFERRVRVSRVTAYPAALLGAEGSTAWHGSFS
jgi:PAS domain S-box-containing protein